MFERLIERAGRAGARRVSARVRGMEAELGIELPQGIGCKAEDEAIMIFGRGLMRRYMLDPALRALLSKVR